MKGYGMYAAGVMVALIVAGKIRRWTRFLKLTSLKHLVAATGRAVTIRDALGEILETVQAPAHN
jgi:hypothetical protein